MALQSLRLEEITASTIDSLRIRKEPEGLHLDYKLAWSLADNKEKREFLADVSSFANATGGDIVFGVREDDGIPVEVVGLQGFREDKDLLMAEQVLTTGLDPRGGGVRFHPVSLANGRTIVIVRIPQSPARPHMIRLGSDQFFLRHSKGKQPMDAQQLRAEFLQSEMALKGFEEFRAERVAALAAGKGPAKMAFSTNVCLHLAPGGEWHDFSADAILQQHLQHFRPMGWIRSMDARPNQLGLILYETLSGDEVSGYVQIFRRGALESVLLLNAGGDDKRISPEYKPVVRAALIEYIKGLRIIGQQPPWRMGLTLLNVEGFAFSVPPLAELRRRATRIGEKNLAAPTQTISSEADVDRALKASCDFFWNTCGFLGSANFDSTGNWRKQQ